jgi:hypothetical protein
MPHAKNGRLQPDRKAIDVEIARLRELGSAGRRATVPLPIRRRQKIVLCIFRVTGTNVRVAQEGRD